MSVNVGVPQCLANFRTMGCVSNTLNMDTGRTIARSHVSGKVSRMKGRSVATRNVSGRISLVTVGKRTSGAVVMVVIIKKTKVR